MDRIDRETLCGSYWSLYRLGCSLSPFLCHLPYANCVLRSLVRHPARSGHVGSCGQAWKLKQQKRQALTGTDSHLKGQALIGWVRKGQALIGWVRKGQALIGWVLIGLQLMTRQHGVGANCGQWTDQGRRLGWVLLAVLAIGVPAPLWAGPELRSREWAIDGFKPPPRWEATPRERPSYPQLIAWASRGDGQERAVISLVAKRVAAGTTVRELLPEAWSLKSWPRVENVRVQVLSTMGWSAGFTGNLRVQVDAVLPATQRERAQVVRQYLFLNGPIAYTMTLVAPAEQAAARLRDLDDTASNLVPLETAPSPPASATPPSATPPSAASPDGGAGRAL